MSLSFTQRHKERKMRMQEKTSIMLQAVDIDEKWGVAHVPAPPSKCEHVWVQTNTQHTTCGKCRTKAKWNNDLLTFTPTGE
jgi:hypothetical protein